MSTYLFHKHFQFTTSKTNSCFYFLPSLPPACFSPRLPHLGNGFISIHFFFFPKAETQRSSSIPSSPSSLPIQPVSKYISVMCALSMPGMCSVSTVISQLDDTSGPDWCPSSALAPRTCCSDCPSGFSIPSEVLPSSLSLPSVLPYRTPPSLSLSLSLPPRFLPPLPSGVAACLFLCQTMKAPWSLPLRGS